MTSENVMSEFVLLEWWATTTAAAGVTDSNIQIFGQWSNDTATVTFIYWMWYNVQSVSKGMSTAVFH